MIFTRAGKRWPGIQPIMNTMAENSVESRAARTIREVFASGRPLTYLRSAEEQRVSRVLREVGVEDLRDTRDWRAPSIGFLQGRHAKNVQDPARPHAAVLKHETHG